MKLYFYVLMIEKEWGVKVKTAQLYEFGNRDVIKTDCDIYSFHLRR